LIYLQFISDTSDVSRNEVMMDGATVESLQRIFNAATHATRLVTLLSPT